MAYGVSRSWALTPSSRVVDSRIGSRAQYRAHDWQSSPYRIREGLPTTCPERDCEADKSNLCQDLTNTQKNTEPCRSHGLSFDVTVDAGSTRL
jgi:hypothetical protein